MDVEWFRLPRREHDPANAIGRLTRGAVLVLIDRGAYFQIGYLIKKGADRALRDAGIVAFRSRIALALPWLADRVDAVESFEDVQLLTVTLNRLRRWYADGLLIIGDAAHAMSPVGGVGINLAIQDALAAGRILGPKLAEQDPHPHHPAAGSATTVGTDRPDPGLPARRAPPAPSRAAQLRHQTARRHQPAPPRTAAAAIPDPTGDSGASRGPRRAAGTRPALGAIPGLGESDQATRDIAPASRARLAPPAPAEPPVSSAGPAPPEESLQRSEPRRPDHPRMAASR